MRYTNPRTHSLTRPLRCLGTKQDPNTGNSRVFECRFRVVDTVLMTARCPSVRLSVYSVDRPQQWRAAGLLLGAQAGRRYRSTVAVGGRRACSSNGAAAANAYSATITAAVAG